jgi:hypothetical protein
VTTTGELHVSDNDNHRMFMIRADQVVLTCGYYLVSVAAVYYKFQLRMKNCEK